MKKINLADLKNNPDIVNGIMKAVEGGGKKKTKKKSKKIKVKVKKETPAIILAADDEEPVEKIKEVKVKHDDDYHAKHMIVMQHIKKAEGFFDQSKPIYASMEILFSSAYRYSDIKNRSLLAQARKLCKEAIKLEENKEKAKDKAKTLGMRVTRKDLAKFSTSSIKEELKSIFSKLYENIAYETKKQQGHGYDDIPKSFAVDLSMHDNSSATITLARANLMVNVGNIVDVNDVKNYSKYVELVHVEGPIFAIKNALIVGFSPYALPKKITDASLEACMAERFQVKATPLPKQMRHPTSNRIWFYVPEYQKVLVKSIAFADRSLNSEFEAFKSLSNNPSEDDVRFLFMRAGADDFQIEAIVRRWRACDSFQGRISILTNEYNNLKRRNKSQRLRMLREQFKESNRELYQTIIKSEDRVEKLGELRSEIKTEFSTLASHTGNPDHGLAISQNKRLSEAFDIIERIAVRGNTDSFERIRIREGIRKDRLEARRLVYDYSDIKKENKELKDKIRSTLIRIDLARDRAFHEIAGK